MQQSYDQDIYIIALSKFGTLSPLSTAHYQHLQLKVRSKTFSGHISLLILTQITHAHGSFAVRAHHVMVSPPSITLHLISYSISLYQLANSTLLFSIFVHLFCFCSLFWLHSGLVCIPSASCMSLSNCPHHTIHSFTLLLIHLCCKVINNNNKIIIIVRCQ